MKLLLLLVIATASVAQAGNSGVCEHWDYSESNCGPAAWSAIKPTCGGHMQSPIDIKKDDVIMANLNVINFKYYDTKAYNMTLKNNGHSAKLMINTETEKVPTITAGGLNGVFKFAQLHFHWGSKTNQGSEHLINGKAFPIEMHLVHYNAAFSDIGAAVASGRPDALAVVGVMFKESASDNKHLQPIVDALAHTMKTDDVHKLATNFAIGDLVPDDHSSFYRYAGSLTTPGCNQIVIWTLMEQKLKISKEQLKAFRKIQDSHKHGIVDNFRPPQPVNGRSILKNSKGMQSGATSAAVASTITILLSLTTLSHL